MRWVLLDEVCQIKRGRSAQAKSRVPESNVSPAFLLTEMMAQAGALAVGSQNYFKEDFVFAKMDSMKMSAPAVPGEALEVEAHAEKLRPEGAWCRGCVRTSRGELAQARFLLANVGRLIPGYPEPVVFHPAFMKHFDIPGKVQ